MVSLKLCAFNFLVLIKLVQIIANSPHTTSIKLSQKTYMSPIDFIVSVKSKSNPFESLCDGYIISPKAILTSAHCIYDSRNSTLYTNDKIFIDFSYLNESAPLDTRSIKSVSTPGVFNISTMSNDISLLFLNEEIKGKSSIGISASTPSGTPYYVATSTIFKEIATLDKCDQPTTDGALCIKDNRHTSTKSPAIFVNDNLVGFESWKSTPENSMHPKEFTNVSHFYNWIQNELRKNSEKDIGIIGILCYAAFTIWVAKRSFKTKEDDAFGLGN